MGKTAERILIALRMRKPEPATQPRIEAWKGEILKRAVSGATKPRYKLVRFYRCARFARPDETPDGLTVSVHPEGNFGAHFKLFGRGGIFFVNGRTR